MNLWSVWWVLFKIVIIYVQHEKATQWEFKRRDLCFQMSLKLQQLVKYQWC